MANITRTALDANALNNFPDNNTNYITPALLRDWLDDAVDSFVTQKDTSRLENAIYENEGSALAAAATVNLASATGNFLHISIPPGPQPQITSFGSCPAGARFVLVFDGVCNLTYNATSLIIPGSANKTTAANDCCMIVSEGSGNWRVVGYFPIAGGTGGGTVTAVTATSPLASSGGNAPNISIQQASGSQNGYLSSSDFATFSGKQDALSAGTGISLASNTVTNTAPDQVVALTSGTGINASGTYPNFTIANTAPDQTVALTPGTGIGITGTYPNFTIANTAPSSGGTVTSIATSSPITGGTITGSGTIGIQDAAADGSTKGAAAFTASDFNAASGVISLDYANGQKASGSQDGFLSSGNWTTFNNKVSTGAVTGSGLTMATSRLLGRTSASTGAIEEISLTTTGTSGAATLSGGVLNIPQYSGGGGSGTVNSGTANRLAYYTGTTAVSSANIGSGIGIDATNNRIGIGVSSPAARLDLALPTGTNPSIILAPSSAVTISGTTNGSIWCDTVASNTSLTMRKDSAYTKILTLDRNPDLATSGSGVLQADANGTLTKGADLTALGIYAQTNSITAITTGSGSLIGTVTGITTLPANFFGVGKTIETKFSGLITMPNGSPVCTIDFRITDGTTTSTLGTLVYDTSNMSNRVYMADCQLTCRTTGAGATFGISGQMIVNHAAKSQETVFITPGSVAIAGLLSTASALTLQVVVTWTGTAGGSIDTRTHFCNYIN